MTPVGFPIAEVLPEPVFVFDILGQLVWMNNASEIWLQKSCDSLVGKPVNQFAPGFDIIAKQLDGVAHGKKNIHGQDLHVRLRNAKEYSCHYLIFPYQEGTALLITSKQQGGGIDAAPRGQAVTMLGQMLAHELKNPLAGIRGAAQLLETGLSSEDDLELTELIKTEVDRIGRLAEQMEGFGQSEPSKYQPFNIHTVLRKATLLFQNMGNADIALIEAYDPSLPPVFGDQDAVMQMVVNLVANAVDAIKTSGEGDKITLQTSYRTGMRRRGNDGETYSLPVGVRILDNGPGINPELRERVFHPFVTGKANGHGLGLALVSKIVEDHGGLIEVATRPGKTAFSILLPTDDHFSKVR